MARMQPTRLPSYRRHKSSGQSVVTLNGKDFYLGLYGTKASRQAYDRLVGEWQTNGRRLPADMMPGGPADMTANELVLAYWKFAKTYYVKDGRPTDEQLALKAAFRPLKRLYGNTQARAFGPLRLKAVREDLNNGKRSRTYINDCVYRIKRLFRWGVENEMIPPSVYHGLQAVAGLRRGRSTARETEPVKPVPDANVKAVLPFVSPQVKAMIQLQELTGMRPCEVVIMRGCNIDTSGELWEYRPVEHKTQHFGRERVITIGPRAKKIVKPLLKPDTSAYLFCPVEAEVERNAKRRANRKSPMTPSQAKRRRKRRRKRPPTDHYTSDSYRRAVHRACQQAWPAPKGLKAHEVRAWEREHHWSPGQLRHNRATKIRKRYGVEAARAVLGHSTAVTTELYAEMDQEIAAKVAREVG